MIAVATPHRNSSPTYKVEVGGPCDILDGI